jgi:glycosyltransferase involved in cell wall biosynthesis
MRVLSLASVFPNALQPNLGVFVRARLQAMTEFADVKAVAPVAYFEYGNPARRGFGFGKVPLRRTDGALEIFHPRWQYLPNAGPVTAFLMAVQVAKFFRRDDYDVIDAHFAFPEGIAAALLSRFFHKPYCITLRGNEEEHSEYRFRGRAIAWAIRNADRVIAVSEELRQFAIRCGAAPDRVKTIPNGIDAGVYHPKTGGRELLARYGVPTDVPIVLSAGYLIERKGHHHAIRALRMLIDRGSPAHLVIVGGPGGEGRYEPVLRQLVVELRLEDRVHFTGNVPQSELALMMSGADVMVLATRKEGWPNVVNEALACGTPVVASDTGGVKDMLCSTDYGAVVPIDDVDALATALGWALGRNWDRKRIAQWGGSRSWRQVATEAVGWLEAAAGRASNASARCAAAAGER